MRKVALLSLIAAALWAPAAALGAEEGVIVDPDTPTGKEYAIPIEQARNEAIGSSRGARVGGAGPLVASGDSLFGEGIRPRREKGSGGSAGALDRLQGDVTRGAFATPSALTGDRSAAKSGSGDSGTLLTLAIPVGVLLVGGAIAAAALRRGRFRRPPTQ